jgi:molybdopterin/thiamine biosynthesis adenylyltransferase
MQNSTAKLNIEEDQVYEDIFCRSTLLISEKQRTQLRQAVVGVVGVGGIGGMATEMLARMGIGQIHVADPDFFEPTNLNRQIFSTFNNAYRHQDNAFLKKAEVAKQRILSINPFAKVQVYANGITLDNVDSFCAQANLLINQPDRESIKSIVHRQAKQHRRPVITASRSNYNANRWSLMVRIWNYRDQPSLQTFEETNHPDLLAHSLDKLTPEFLDAYDRQDTAKVQARWLEIIETQPEAFGLLNKEECSKVVKLDPKKFHKHHIIAPLANIAGSMASLQALKLLLHQPVSDMTYDFWNGG